ncbi:MAG: GSU2403 family nucleotidyltransferase fold protein [Nitrospiraceae bacterium]|nr:GSU2403 family nucleotidyltransferase fold protein [Nitrospiraceae bacterium]
MPDKSGFEAELFGVLDDLSAYLADLTLVGGWVPYLYARFLWRTAGATPVFTSDVDLGLAPEQARAHSKTIFDTLSSLKYSERHLELGKLHPVVFYRKNKTRLDFIAPAGAGDSAANKLLGREIALNRLEDFAFLIDNVMEIPRKRGGREHVVRCPRPGAFVLHKCATFTDRDDRQKMGKDLYYAYFVLRHAPDQEALAAEMRQYGKEAIFAKASSNIKEYFGGEGGRGCAMVEKEYGPDEYLEDLHGDISERFSAILQLNK